MSTQKSFDVHNHWLSADHATHDKVTGKDSGAYASGLPDTIVIHYTGGPSLRSAVNTFKNPEVRASAHIVIDYDGSVVQLIPFNRRAWHAGQSQWGERTSLNQYSIGIEIVNPGYLMQHGNIWYGMFQDRYEADKVIQAVHANEQKPRWWRVFEPEQIAACKALCEALIETYNIKEILGHDEISPGRKQDPGPAFPLERIRTRLLDTNRSDETGPTPTERRQGTVTASSLNIRKAPNAGSDRVADPLPKGTSVRILKEENGWMQVETPLKGWVSTQFVNER
ncbi:N-acetylmuramoyl-L-alanine amidase [Cyclonatronum proteinivorum]|uniref:N-acetylmuramoyl-L-alanine amidase n=1 Tax=Cyclonatronum proteinivorum TaxID=1457365 RepID=A0A345UHM8_9BACT|nr:N-acetylmuramoyl-L-alanine amidase [Cyclonatronum proteinivorum]AXI99979.1 N-acetylmuramoyl-L-alanine amidase [Cyclonatronum proteinivorum]